MVPVCPVWSMFFITVNYTDMTISYLNRHLQLVIKLCEQHRERKHLCNKEIPIPRLIIGFLWYPLLACLLYL